MKEKKNHLLSLHLWLFITDESGKFEIHLSKLKTFFTVHGKIACFIQDASIALVKCPVLFISLRTFWRKKVYAFFLLIEVEYVVM